jgi:hypothetical protein
MEHLSIFEYIGLWVVLSALLCFIAGIFLQVEGEPDTEDKIIIIIIGILGLPITILLGIVYLIFILTSKKTKP